MNAERRKSLNNAISLLQEASAKLDAAKSIVEEAKDAERDYYDNMPESFQSGERGERADAAASSLEDAVSSLEDIDIDSIMAQIEEALQ